MSKAFTREDASLETDDDEVRLPDLPAGSKNYITPVGFARLRDELKTLIEQDRPKVVEIVSWAASNGDRSENGDYIYGKKRLREIDRRIRFLTKRLDLAEVVDPSRQHGNTQIFFGATVRYAEQSGAERLVTIVGVDEVDLGHGFISWISPVARALLKAREGDVVSLPTPGGLLQLDILEVTYPQSGT
jgi:transcription elongation factor GreB